MVWGSIGCTSRLPLIPMDGTLNNGRYIFVTLRPVALRFIQFFLNLMFQKDNARPHVAGIFQNFLDTENFRMLPCPAHSPDFSPMLKFW